MGSPEDQANEVALWRRYDEIEARLTAPVSARMLDLAKVGSGARVLDVATGRGEPAIPAAVRVGGGGFVLGIDRNPGLLEIARERALHEGLSNVEFRQGDAEDFTVDGPFDVATLRWGLMLFPHPERALACVRRALAPRGALVLAVWGGPDEVDFAGLPRRVLARFREVPPVPDDSPGVFRYADPTSLETVLGRARFAIESLEAMSIPVIETADGAGFVAWVRAFRGPFNQWVDELPEGARKDWERALAEEAERHRQGETIRIGGLTRLVLARAS